MEEFALIMRLKDSRKVKELKRYYSKQTYLTRQAYNGVLIGTSGNFPAKFFS
jgi:predicted transcriptional regulator